MLVDQILPPQSMFLRNYCKYAAACSDAPPIYSVGVGLTMLAGVAAKKLICPWMAGRSLMPNLYTILVGGSRSARKTAAIDLGVDLVGAVDPQLVCPIAGSYEEQVAQIRRRPEGIIVSREFGHLLKTTQRGYGEPIRTLLMDLYDWPPHRPYMRNLKKGQTIIEAPIALSLVGGIATDLLYAYADLEEWTGGFFARMLLLYGEREECRLPLTWPAAQNHLTATLNGILQWDIPPCGGFAPDAWAAFEEWAIHQDTKENDLPPRVRHFNAGATTLAAKIALLYALDAGEPQAGAGWQISHAVTQRAIWFVMGPYLSSVRRLGNELAIGYWERDRQKVLDAVVAAGPKGLLRWQLVGRVKLDLDSLERVLDALKEERLIAQVQHPGGSGTMYRLATPEDIARATTAPSAPLV